MKVTVCQLRNDPAELHSDWQQLVAHVRQHRSELVLLPEMTFSPWALMLILAIPTPRPVLTIPKR